MTPKKLADQASDELGAFIRYSHESVGDPTSEQVVTGDDPDQCLTVRMTDYPSLGSIVGSL